MLSLEPKTTAGPSTGIRSERLIWETVGTGWRPLYASFHQAGFSFEWHDFESLSPIPWDPSFHPHSLEICLNLEGAARISDGTQRLALEPNATVFYYRGTKNLNAQRLGPGHHRFLTVELSLSFLRNFLEGSVQDLHPLVQKIVQGDEDPPCCGLGPQRPLSMRQNQILTTLMDPPVLASAQPLWFRAKALEMASELLFNPKCEEELFCLRQKRVARERTDKVIAILKRDLVDPPSLENLGRKVGCSPYYLSRIFSRETGLTIPQYLRKIRMERAADLLRSGKHNVTETAMMVGYNSLSHFSQAFCQTIGCCPNLYPKVAKNR